MTFFLLSTIFISLPFTPFNNIAVAENNWVVSGNTVYVDDALVYASATPHTISGSEDVVFEFKSKVYTGNVDFAWGFNQGVIKPTAIWLWQNYTHSLPVNTYQQDWGSVTLNSVTGFTSLGIQNYDLYNVTLGNKNNTYLYQVSYGGNKTDIYAFTTFSNVGSTYTISGNYSHWVTVINNVNYFDWNTWDVSYNHIQWNYQDTTDWYVTQPQSIVADVTYKCKIRLEQQHFGLNGISGKYWFAFKPSTETLSQSVANNHFYCLDPWWNIDWQYSKVLNIANKRLGSQMKIVVGNNSGGNVSVGGHIKQGNFFKDVRFVNMANTTEYYHWMENCTANTQATFWVNNSDNASSMMLYYGYSVCANSTYRNGTNTFSLFDDFSGSAIKTSIWQGATTSCTVSSGVMIMYGGLSGNKEVTSKSSWTSDILIRSLQKENTVAGHSMTFGFCTADYNNRAVQNIELGSYNTYTVGGGVAHNYATGWTHAIWRIGQINIDRGVSIDWFQNNTRLTNAPVYVDIPLSSVSMPVYIGTEHTVYTYYDWIFVARLSNQYWSSFSAEITNTAQIPNPPYNQAWVQVGSNINISWLNGTGAKKTVLRMSATTQPLTPTDGTEIYNGTGKYTVQAVTGTFHITLFSLNTTSGYFSTGVYLTSYFVYIICYDEATGLKLQNYTVFFFNPSGTETFAKYPCLSPCIINNSDVPLGNDISMVVNKSGYSTRTYIFNIISTGNYYISVYLTANTTLYLLTVVNPNSIPISDAKITISKYINTTAGFENVSISFTDGAGQITVFLQPFRLYKFCINHSGYKEEISDWIPSESLFTHTFMMEYLETALPPEYIEVVITVVRVGTEIHVNYTDAMGQTQYTIVFLYSINSTTGNLTLLSVVTNVSEDNLHIVFAGTSTTISYKVVVEYNHTAFGSQTAFRIIDRVIIPITTSARLNGLLVGIIGNAGPFLWTSLITFVAFAVMMFHADKKDCGKYLMVIGGILFFVAVIGFHDALATTIPILFVLVGIIMEWINARR